MITSPVSRHEKNEHYYLLLIMSFVVLQDIPSLTAEAAKEHPGVSYIITAPLGLHELLVVKATSRLQ